jgi:outer membrane protein OmpA-like peptidoglycan-associated protein
MKKLIFIIISFLFAGFSFGQIWQEDVANDLFKSRDYVHAIPEYEKLIKLNKNTEYLYQLGMCYYYLKDYTKAQVYLEEVKEKSKTSKDAVIDAFLYDAICEHYLGMYNEAKANYQLYIDKGGVCPNILNYIKSCDYALTNQQLVPRLELDTTRIRIDGLYLGGAWHNGKLVYSQPDHVHDKIKKTVYPYYKVNDVEGEVVNEKGEPLFHQFYTGGICFSADGKEVYFTRNESDEKFIQKKHYAKHQISADGVNTLGIYKASVDHNKWTNIEHLNFNSIDHSCMHPYITADGNKLFFSSNRSGGFGGYDLYYVQKLNGEWGEAINCGKYINSLDDEMFPHLMNDTILYFSSDGHIGYGGSDIYYSVKQNGMWQVPTNAGLPLNSSKDDFALIFADGNSKGFFGSDRFAAPGKDDIFSFTIKPDLIIGRGVVLDKLSLKPIPGAHVKIHTPDSIIEVIADENGKFEWDFFVHHKMYHIEYKADKYEPESMDFEADTSITLHLDKKLEPHLEKNMVFTFNDILFEYNKADLLPESKLVLDRLAEVLLHSGAKVELSAHTDSRGSDKYNLSLSQKRALSAVNYLITKGVPIEKAIGIGFGETKLKNNCDDGVTCNEEEHTLNRRVEIKIMEVSSVTQ